MLGPDDAVDGLGRRVSDRASGKCLGRWLWQAVVALCEALLDQSHLTKIAGASALDQRNIGGETQPIDVAASRLVVQCVEDDRELLEVLNVVLDT